MNSHPPLEAVSLLALLCAAPAAFAINVAGPTFGGTGICGVNSTSTLTALGTPRANAGTTGNINDGNPATRVDTWFGGNAGTYSYVGIRWPFQRADSVKTLTLNMACFGDGGWFGFAGVSPSPGGALTSVSHLIEPSVQVTTDGGVTWSAVDIATDYLTQLENHNIGGGGFPNPNPKSFTITLNTPASGINGIRIIGENGGLAGTDINGFLGIMELAVDAGPVVDTDNDGMEDSWETDHGLIVGVDDSLGDAETPPDGLPNGAEFLANTDPQDPDTDNDGLNDGLEVFTHFTNPHVTDSDGDGLSDGAEVNTHGSNPALTDTDGDGLSDGAEVNTHGSSPTNSDSDGDQFPDGLEVARGFSPASDTSRPANIAFLGTGYMGLNDALDTDNGTTYVQGGATAANLLRIVDENLTTRSDTFHATDIQTFGFTGVTWSSARALPIARVEVTLACFGDGGWWGRTNNRPGLTGDTRFLSAGNLPLVDEGPVVQVTTTAVPQWTTIASTTNYDLAAGVIGHPIGGGSSPNPTLRTISFNITDPAGTASSVTGIRIIGREGGTAGTAPAAGNPDPRGFLGVWEVVVKDTFSENDLDGDGLSNADETTNGTDFNLPDSDFDGLTDNAELNIHSTSPTDNDSDNDGFLDGVEIALGTEPIIPGSRPSNIARAGIGTSGVNNGIDADNGTLVNNSANPAAPATLFPTRFHASTNVNDGNINSRVDTFNTGTANNFSYVGVRWPALWPQPVSRLELQMATFLDGGWFGPNSAGPGSGGALTGAHLTVPTVQITTDGINWSSLPGGTTVTDNYLTKMTGHVIGGGPAGNPTRTPMCAFNIDPPIPAGTISGIRLIGREGGTAPATAAAGFLGIYEFGVQDTTTSNDLDSDGLTNSEEVTLGTDPENPDSDGDGLNDGLEVNTYGSNPLNADSDGDMFRDGYEHQSGSHPAQATSFPDNVALLGTAILGVHDTIDSNPGTSHFQAGVLASINDGNAATRVDTYNGAGGIHSFVGILWTTPQTIKTLTMNFATFFDGGWFGPNGIDPGAGGALNPSYLSEPTVQISTDGGTTWTTVSHASDYLTVMNGHNIGGGAFPNPSSRTAVFTLDAPAVVTGVRLIGSEGGTASGGFLGCFELGVGHGPVPGDADNDGLPDAWEVAKFGYVHAQHLRMDTDGDGSDNLLESGLGMDPLTADQPPAGQLEGGYLTMTITKVPGIAYSVLSGSDTTGWSTADTTVLIDDATTLKVRDNTPIATGPRRFLKTEVSPDP